MKMLKSRRYYLPKGISKNYNMIINRKNFYEPTVAFDIKRYKEIRKLTMQQAKNYTKGCLLGY